MIHRRYLIRPLRLARPLRLMRRLHQRLHQLREDDGAEG